MAVEAIVYQKVGNYDPNAWYLFTGDDATVDAEWTQVSTTTPGVLSDGTAVWYAIKYTGATLSDANNIGVPQHVISGTIAATYGGQPKIPGSYPITLATGANNDIACLGFANVISGPGGAFNITGVAGGYDGKVIKLVNTVAQNMTITDDSGSSAAGNRIYTYGTVVTTGVGTVELTYVGILNHWVVTGLTA